MTELEIRVSFLEIFCTDRRQHPETNLGNLTFTQYSHNRGSWQAPLNLNQAVEYGRIAERRKSECVWIDHLDPGSKEYRVHMRCPRCQRHVQWTDARAQKLVPELARRGRMRLDLSIMP